MFIFCMAFDDVKEHKCNDVVADRQRDLVQSTYLRLCPFHFRFYRRRRRL